MPRYFFDIIDGGYTKDDEGVELPNPDAVRATAMEALPKIAAEEIPNDGDKRHFVVFVKDESGKPIYSATLSFIGLWLTG